MQGIVHLALEELAIDFLHKDDACLLHDGWLCDFMKRPVKLKSQDSSQPFALQKLRNWWCIDLTNEWSTVHFLTTHKCTD